jgi:hypothetical protein
VRELLGEAKQDNWGRSVGVGYVGEEETEAEGAEVEELACGQLLCRARSGYGQDGGGGQWPAGEKLVEEEGQVGRGPQRGARRSRSGEWGWLGSCVLLLSVRCSGCVGVTR